MTSGRERIDWGRSSKTNHPANINQTLEKGERCKFPARKWMLPAWKSSTPLVINSYKCTRILFSLAPNVSHHHDPSCWQMTLTLSSKNVRSARKQRQIKWRNSTINWRMRRRWEKRNSKQQRIKWRKQNKPWINLTKWWRNKNRWGLPRYKVCSSPLTLAFISRHPIL